MHRSDFSGVAYIEQVTGFIPRAFPIEGHWELPGLDHVAEDGPGWQTASEAVSWGRKRAPAVWLRVHRNIYSHRYAHADSIPRLRRTSVATCEWIIRRVYSSISSLRAVSESSCFR